MSKRFRGQCISKGSLLGVELERKIYYKNLNLPSFREEESFSWGLGWDGASGEVPVNVEAKYTQRHNVTMQRKIVERFVRNCCLENTVQAECASAYAHTCQHKDYQRLIVSALISLPEAWTGSSLAYR